MTAAFPYRVFSPSLVDASGWRFAVDNLPLADHLPAWDYMSEHVIQRTFMCNGRDMRVGCGLGPTARLAVVARYWSTGNHLHLAGEPVEIPAADGPQELDVQITLTGATFSGDLQIETSVVLAAADASAGVFSPHRVGSVLWRDVHAVRLQGSAGVMPTTPLRFSESGLPEHAAWVLDFDASRWEAPLFGSLQVLLNVENPDVGDALAGRLPREAAGVLWHALRVDIVMDILLSAFADPDFDPTMPSHDEDGTLLLGGFVNGLIRRNLRKVSEAVPEAFLRLKAESAEPPRFRARVQDGLARGRASA